MIDFLVKYWRVIFELLMLIASIVLFILKKKPIKITDSVRTIILDYLPSIINFVESKSRDCNLNGSQKLETAISLIDKYLSDKLGLNDFEILTYRGFIVQQIEAILSTPQKKEVKYED